MIRRLVPATAVLAMASLSVLSVSHASSASAAPLRKFKNCTTMNNVYPHGVGIRGALDQTSEKVKVTNFRIDGALYRFQSKALDRDNDGIACEKA